MEYLNEFPIKVDPLKEVSLALLKENDFQELFALVDKNRAFLREFLPWLDHNQTEEDSVGFINSVTDSNKLGKTLIACVKRGPKIIGVSGFNTIDLTNKVGKIGYWISQNEQGLGSITKSVKTLMDFGFEKIQLNKVEIRCCVTNRPSKKIPEKLSFKLEGTLREVEWLYDHFVDHDVYGLLKEEWENL